MSHSIVLFVAQCLPSISSSSQLQILLDSLHRFLCIVADQCAIGILGRFSSSCTVRCILIALFDCVECFMVNYISTLRLGLGQKAQAVRFEYDIFGDQKLLATISLFVAI